jgi:hypothetical protein
MASRGWFWSDFASDFASFLAATGLPRPVRAKKRQSDLDRRHRYKERQQGDELPVFEPKALSSEHQIARPFRASDWSPGSALPCRADYMAPVLGTATTVERMCA